MSKYLDKEGLAQLWAKMKKYIADKDIKTATPVGGSIVWYGPEDTIPSDWMREDGRSLNKNSYPDLFAVIGYTYGGSGNNFNLPDSRGQVIVHINESDTEFSSLAKKYGTKTHKLIIDEMPAHYHDTANTDDKAEDGELFSNITAMSPRTWQDAKYWWNITSTVGGNQPHNNIQPSLSAYRIIKVKEDAYSKNLRNLDNAISEIKRKLTPHYLGIKCNRHTQKIEKTWTDYTITDFVQKNGAEGDVLELTENGIKIKKDCYIEVHAQGTVNVPVSCDISPKIFRVHNGENIIWDMTYQRSVSWSSFHIFSIGRCTANDIMKLAISAGALGDFEFLNNTNLQVKVMEIE